jgi:hypothetical protein
MGLMRCRFRAVIRESDILQFEKQTFVGACDDSASSFPSPSCWHRACGPYGHRPCQGRANELGIYVPAVPFVGYSKVDSDKGVMVGLTDINRPSDLARKFIGALQGAELDVKRIEWHQQTTGIDFDLFIESRRDRWHYNSQGDRICPF